jgi:hypothetical protein
MARCFPQCCSWLFYYIRGRLSVTPCLEKSGRLSTLCLLLGWLCQRDEEWAGRLSAYIHLLYLFFFRWYTS